MITTSISHQAKLNSWISRFDDQKKSGLTIAGWCEHNNFSIHQFYYWKRILKESCLESVLPEIVPVNISAPAIIDPAPAVPVSEICSNIIKISIGDAVIEINSLTAPEVLCNVIRAVRHA